MLGGSSRRTLFLSMQPLDDHIGVKGFPSRVIYSLCVMGQGSGQFEIFVFRFLNTTQEYS